MQMEKAKPISQEIDIDKNALDNEWLRQPQLYHKYAKKLANAEDYESQLRTKLEGTEASLSTEARTQPEKFGIVGGRSTPGVEVVRMAVLQRKEYQEVLSKYNEAKLKTSLIRAVVRTLEHRKTALESLVYLHGQSYFSDRPRHKTNESVNTIKKEKNRTKIKRRKVRE